MLKKLIKILPNNEREKIKKQIKLCWSNTGKTFFELLILPKIISIHNKISISGIKYIEEIKNKEQVIFVGIHESNWEILLPSLDKLGIPVGGILQTYK